VHSYISCLAKTVQPADDESQDYDDVYALLMIQGKCSDRSPLIVTFFAILITGTQVMVKVVAKYSSYIAVYRLKNM
jgi:hypothetical protein